MKNKIALLLSVAALLPATGAFAQTTLYWSGGTSNIGTNGIGISQGSVGTWDNSTANWDAGAGVAHTAWGSGDNAVLAATNIAVGAGVVTLGAAITANSVTISTTNYILTDGGVSGNTLTVNNVTNSQPVTMSNNIVNSTTFTKAGSSTLTLLAASPGLDGTINVAAGTLALGSSGSLALTGPTAFSSVSVASNATFKIQEMGNTLTYVQTISGGGAVSVTGSNYSTVVTLAGSSTFTGPVTVNQTALAFTTIDDTNACALGNGTNVTIATSSSTTSLNYMGYGNVTARTLTLGGTTPGTSLVNNGYGPLVWNGALLFGTTNQHTFGLSGTATYNSVFGGTIPDNTVTNTIVSKSGAGTWLLFGSNTYSGGTLISGGTLVISNDFGLGTSTGAVAFTASATLKSISNNVTLGSARMVTVTNNVTAGFSVADTNNLNVAAYLTGPGYVQRSSSSYTLGTVRFSNDTNSYTGAFTAGYGTTEFTSVANSGTVSSLGAGLTNGGTIVIGNATSSGTLRYVGTGNSATTRALNWTATTAGFDLDVTNTGGTIAYLNTTSNLVSGAGAKTLVLTGSQTGTNTMGQVINDSSSGATSVYKSGNGQWVLAGANTYSGITTVAGGTLTVSQDANFGTAPGSATANSLLLSGGTLSATAGFTLNANRGIALGPTTGLTASGSGTISVAAGQTLSYGGVMANGSSTNYGHLVKTGAGTLALSGVNLYTGNTTVSAGTLALSGSGSITGTTNLIINAGGTLDVSGVSGGYALATGQTLWATNRATATVNGSLNLGSAGLVLIYTNGTPTVNVTGGALTLSAGTTVSVTVTNGGNPLAAGSYKIISKGTGGSVAGTAPPAVTVGGSGIAAGTTATLAITGGELYLTVSSGTLYQPVLSGLSYGLTGPVLTFSGTNGQTYTVLATTNLLLPVTNWSILSTGTLTGAAMTYTNLTATNSQQFYLIKSP